MKLLSRQLRALANERRLKILVFLAKHRELTVGGVAELLKASFRSTSRHLQTLKSAGIIEDEQRSKYVYYHLRRDHAVYRCLAHLLTE